MARETVTMLAADACRPFNLSPLRAALAQRVDVCLYVLLVTVAFQAFAQNGSNILSGG